MRFIPVIDLGVDPAKLNQLQGAYVALASCLNQAIRKMADPNIMDKYTFTAIPCGAITQQGGYLRVIVKENNSTIESVDLCFVYDGEEIPHFTISGKKVEVRRVFNHLTRNLPIAVVV